MKIVFLTLILINVFLSNIYAQEKRARVLDRKVWISEEMIKKLANGQLDSAEIQALPAAKHFKKFTNNTESDIELHAAINPTDSSNIIISWMRMNPGNSTMPLVFELYYTEDFGQTWQTGEIDFMPKVLTPPNEAMSGGGDPMIVFDKNGKAYISWIYSVVRAYSQEEIYVDFYLTYASSDDKGATWTRAEGTDKYISYGTMNYELTGGFQNMESGNFPDKQWMAVNPVNNDLFVSLAEFNSTGNYDSGIDTWGIRRKPADQTLFEEKVLVPPAGTLWAQLGAMAIDKNGNIHAIYPYYHLGFPSPAEEKIVHCISTDNGATYSEPHDIALVNVTNFKGVGQENPTSNKMYERMYPASYIAIDTCSTSQYEGRIYVVWNSGDAAYTKKVDVLISYSDDSGTSWSTPRIVNTDPPRNYGFHHRPTIYVNPEGVVVLAWYDNRGFNVPNVYYNNYYYALSFDGSATFEEFKVSDQAWNYNADGFDASVGIGEYFQILATKHNVIAFYGAFDGEDVEIYYNILPFGEETDIETVGTLKSGLSVKSYPNPVTDNVNITISTPERTDCTFKLSDISGKEYLCRNFGQTKSVSFQTDMSVLTPGIYILSVETSKGRVIKKIVKK